MIRKFVQVLLLSMMTIALLLSVQAGPILICHPYDIGDAKSLPWAGKQWRDVKKDYDSSQLVQDTLTLLNANTPVIVRMETLRRATIYAVWAKYDREVGYQVQNDNTANELLMKLHMRVREADAKGRPDALALFDLGYYVESLRNSVQRGDEKFKLLAKLDGYGMVKKALALRSNDPAMEFAAALITSIGPRGKEHQAHKQKAVAGARADALLARNITIQPLQW
jgi:hypothetical protein